MQKENKRARVAELHRQIVMDCAKGLFLEKGYEATSMEEICEVSTYSRRTIYKYFKNKEDIYLHLVYQGLENLHQEIKLAINSTPYFMAQYRAVCNAMKAYYQNHPHSFQAVNQRKSTAADQVVAPQILSDISTIGEEINLVLISYIEAGIKVHVVLDTIHPRQTVYVLWSSISALLEMAENKEEHIKKQFGISIDDFLQYGFDQIIDSILEERIHGAA
ncbi:MAG: TetR/AcrR family transcriptional regulator [Anaerolineaceae bacterium]|nr:TetR/AcrR family transcriptional regulator [Anaerolineaceae bacterium]